MDIDRLWELLGLNSGTDLIGRIKKTVSRRESRERCVTDDSVQQNVPNDMKRHTHEVCGSGLTSGEKGSERDECLIVAQESGMETICAHLGR
jgi:hypothetical protein